MLKIIRYIFLYLDRNYLQPKNLKSVLMVGYEQFIECFIKENYPIYCQIMETILN